MDGQKISHSKLTRTKSSLLRSSPTLRSSVHSFSSLPEEDPNPITPPHHEEQPKPNQNRKMLNRTGPSSVSFNSARFTAVLASGSLLITLMLLFFFYFRREEILSSESLLLILILIAISLFFVSKNRALIRHHISILKTLHNINKNRFFSSKGSSKSVEWYIGDPETNQKPQKQPSFQNHRIIREGVEFYSNGDYYEGEFHKGKCNGSGVYNFMVNGRYEGDWVDGKYDGYGVESWSRGSRYRGQYRQGLRHGYGVYKFYTGDCYAGEWCNGQSHGIGVQSCKDGSCYVGDFKCGVKHGLGCYYFRNGDRYAGEYFGDKIHGFGVYHFANGHCYEGSWHEGKKQGYGMYTFRSGESRCGEWDSGSLKNSLPPLTDAVLRAVQAARKSAENAIHLRRVDEQVNKAIAAANRAATAARVAAVKAVQNRMDGKFCDIDV